MHGPLAASNVGTTEHTCINIATKLQRLRERCCLYRNNIVRGCDVKEGGRVGEREGEDYTCPECVG